MSARKKAPAKKAPTPKLEPTEAEIALTWEAVKRRQDKPQPVTLTVEEVRGEQSTVGPDHNDVRGWLIRLGDTFGTKSDDFTRVQLNAIMSTVSKELSAKEQALMTNSMLAAIAAVQPRDETEGMLAMQMAATHSLAMSLLRQTGRSETIRQLDSNGNMAVKMLRTYTAQLETLAKIQRGGEQKVKVEHRRQGHGAECGER
jgi:hypothetical protein